MFTAETSVADWVRLVQSEYLEIPGLHLTKAQVQRLWNFDADACDIVLTQLVGAGFLRCTAAGAYVRTDLDAR